MSKAIGLLKSQKLVYCTICNSALMRKASSPITANTQEQKEKASKIVAYKLSQPYTCRICQLILNSNKP
jgi:hypothetical protein